jgi:hypothetical protein
MVRLIRILKLMHKRDDLLNTMDEYFQLNEVMKKFIFYFFILMLIVHIVSCIWISLVHFRNKEIGEASWIDPYIEMSNNWIYLTAFYWTITTITTVGYGDITGENNYERFVSIFIMGIGAILWSFLIGSVSNLLSSIEW